MKIIDAINKINELKPNSTPQENKIQWLSELDHLIVSNVINAHDNSNMEFNGYDTETDLETELLVPTPYDEMYVYWLQAKIDYWNQDMDLYEVSMTMYNNAYEQYGRHYIRTHTPPAKSFKYS